jgi:hypothetical protein
VHSNGRPNRQRRAWLRVVTGAAVAAPLGMFVTQTGAIQNGPGRGALKYQDSPNAGKDCLGCAEFLPGRRRRIVEGAPRSPVIPKSPLMAGA